MASKPVVRKPAVRARAPRGETVAIIPARGGSKRLKRKNVLLLAGKPLIVHSIDAAKRATLVDRVVVSTDNAEIARVSKAAGAEVIMRPAVLATDKAHILPVLQHAVTELERTGVTVKAIVLLQPTSPLRTSGDIDRTIRALQQSKKDAAITAYDFSHPADSLISLKKNHFIQHLTPREKFHLYRIDGAVYVLGRETLMGRKPHIFSTKSSIVLMPAERSIDIDTLADMKIAEAILRSKRR